MKILKAPNPILNQKSLPVKKVNREILEIIDQMKKTLLKAKNPKGVGLAAPQVGKSLRIFIIKPWSKSSISLFINPEVIWKSTEKTEEGVPERENKFEGCLSLPDIWGLVRRAQKIKVRYQQLIANDKRLTTKTRMFSGFLATIIQHEMDHLNGTLFPQRVLEQKEKLYKLTKGEEGEEVFEKIKI